MDDDGYVTNEVHQQLQDILTGIGKAKKKVINLTFIELTCWEELPEPYCWVIK